VIDADTTVAHEGKNLIQGVSNGSGAQMTYMKRLCNIGGRVVNDNSLSPADIRGAVGISFLQYFAQDFSDVHTFVQKNIQVTGYCLNPVNVFRAALL